MENTEKGRLYENQIVNYIINELGKEAFLWKNTPEYILIENGIIGSHNANAIMGKNNCENPLQDTSVDIIQLEDDNSCSLIQCKNGVTMENLAGFTFWMLAFEELNGYVYYTSKLSKNILSLPVNKRLQYIKQSFIKPEVIDTEEFIVDESKLIYQNDASNKAIEYFTPLHI